VAAAKQEEMSVEVNGRQLKFTNLNKVFYPKEGYTKRDVINYYDSVAEMILPHLKDRPLSLKRYPNGIHDDFFFQKDVKENFASWLRTELIYNSDTSEKPRLAPFHISMTAASISLGRPCPPYSASNRKPFHPASTNCL